MRRKVVAVYALTCPCCDLDWRATEHVRDSKSGHRSDRRPLQCLKARSQGHRSDFAPSALTADSDGVRNEVFAAVALLLRTSQPEPEQMIPVQGHMCALFTTVLTIIESIA